MQISQVALIGIRWISRLIAPLTHGTSEAHINEDDEVILELDMTSTDSSVAKPKRNESNRSTVPWIFMFCIFMTCGFGALGIALYAQISVISESEGVWHNMAISSGMTGVLEPIFPFLILYPQSLQKNFRGPTFELS
jgi:phosphotransferase system  glucose/maltose/N-acetylglucosamine-specific IIC component